MAHLNIINTSRGPNHKYQNLKMKLYNYNANIHFNQKYSQKKLIPNYANITIPNTSPAARYTQHNTTQHNTTQQNTTQSKNQRRDKIPTYKDLIVFDLFTSCLSPFSSILYVVTVTQRAVVSLYVVY